LIFSDQAQQLQPVRLAGIGGEHLHQNLFGLPPLALLNQVCGLQNRRGKVSLHNGSILENSPMRRVFLFEASTDPPPLARSALKGEGE